MINDIITSPQNTRIKELVKLRQRRHRDKHKTMIIDSIRPLTLALKNDFHIETIYYQQDLASNALLELAQKKSVALQAVTSKVFEKIGYGDNPDGHLGIARQPEFNLRDLPCPPNALYIIAESLEKPGNLGAILRSADAAGVSGLIICDSRTDIYNPNIIRSSLGAFFTVPIAVSGSNETIDWLTQKNIQILAAIPEAEKSYIDIDLTRPTAFAIGNEHSGLTKKWLSQTPVRIPMTGQVDSLNAAQTATILLFETVRQRGKK